MHQHIKAITEFCLAKGIIKDQDAVWFSYGLERRVTTLIVAIPFFFVASALTNILTAISYFVSYFFLRTKTNGYHAHTLIGCIALSLLVEVFFCAALYPIEGTIWIALLIAISCSLIYCFAPYVHENLPLPASAVSTCRQQARFRGVLLSSVALIVQLLGLTALSKGVTMGITTASCMLCIPYIKRKVIAAWKRLTKKSEFSPPK